MSAEIITRFGGPSSISAQEVPVPRSGEGEVLVRVVGNLFVLPGTSADQGAGR